MVISHCDLVYEASLIIPFGVLILNSLQVPQIHDIYIHARRPSRDSWFRSDYQD